MPGGWAQRRCSARGPFDTGNTACAAASTAPSCFAGFGFQQLIQATGAPRLAPPLAAPAGGSACRGKLGWYDMVHTLLSRRCMLVKATRKEHSLSPKGPADA